ncbi:(2Fe-2S) ferredoxin domain-containing protein [Morganella morganii]|uniref:(2Fe-2S) ferredoxin domain-containing protein n=1 Tax=Morganella morganii TaxID=582 RepID=UPI003119D45C
MGKNVTLYLNTLQNEACLSADFWLSLSEKGFPGDTACCVGSGAVLHQLKETVTPETRCVLLMVLTDPAQSGEKLMSLTSALELEIAEYYPQLRVFRSLCVLTRGDSAADAKQAGDVMTELEKQSNSREPKAESNPNWEKTPPYRYHLFFCMGPRCVCRGAKSLLMQLRHQLVVRNLFENENGVLLTRSHCQYPCNQGPLVTVYPDNLWYRLTTPEEIHLFVSEQIEQGRVVPSLLADHK